MEASGHSARSVVVAERFPLAFQSLEAKGKISISPRSNLENRSSWFNANKLADQILRKKEQLVNAQVELDLKSILQDIETDLKLDFAIPRSLHEEIKNATISKFISQLQKVLFKHLLVHKLNLEKAFIVENEVLDQMVDNCANLYRREIYEYLKSEFNLCQNKYNSVLRIKERLDAELVAKRAQWSGNLQLIDEDIHLLQGISFSCRF